MFGVSGKLAKLEWHVSEVDELERILEESLKEGHKTHVADAAHNIREHAKRAYKLIDEIERHLGSSTELTGWAMIVLGAAVDRASDF